MLQVNQKSGVKSTGLIEKNIDGILATLFLFPGLLGNEGE